MLLNLISNSLKFTERGGSITVEISQITKSYDEYLHFSVIDTGIGIPEEDIPKLFQMFSMLDQHKVKMNQKGTDIGLAISKKIVESLGGDLIVKSEEGKYSEFSFTILCRQIMSSSKCLFIDKPKNNTDELFFKAQKNVETGRMDAPITFLKSLILSPKSSKLRQARKFSNELFEDSHVNLDLDYINEAKSNQFIDQLKNIVVANTSRALADRLPLHSDYE